MTAQLTANITTVILAAGASSRFNGCKITAQIKGGQSLLAHSIETLKQVTQTANIAPAAVVLGAHINDDILAMTEGLPRIINPHWQTGLSSSVKQAVAYAIDAKADALLLVLADQVAITANEYLSLIEAFLHNRQTCCSFYLQDVGVPAIFLADDFSALMSIEGDKGAKSVLKQHAKNNNVTILPIDNAARDIDTPADLAHWLNQP
ncbi:nucleotidyltransferase family protein [Shewanella algicola]|uniref:nucleotidyltransferase family protein n=1 Tax=Shewanella algicola TaxID=640633 RepID=UPI0024954521|nr:nucleotidyltransferase family protein [Shewanella algicola]